MQTVTPIVTSGAAASAAASPDDADKLAFPTTLRGALRSQGGNTSPSTDGKTMPDDAQTAPTAAAAATASASLAAAVTPRAASTSEGGNEGGPSALTTTPKAPTISNALHEIAASRRVARAGATPSTDDAAAKNGPGPATPGGRTMPVRSIMPANPLPDTALAVGANRGPHVAPDAAATASAPLAAPLTLSALPLGGAASADNAARNASAAPDQAQTAPAPEAAPLAVLALPPTGAGPADDAARDANAAPDTAATVPVPPLAPLAVPALPPGSPGNNKPVANAATQHAREVVLDRPAASRAWGLLGKAPSADTATADSAAPSADPALPASPAAPLNAGGDTTHRDTASANPSPFAAATKHAQSAPDFAALGAPALAAAGGHTTPPLAVAVGTAAPTSAPPDINIAAQPGSPQFGLEVGERVLWLVRDGLQEARLQLNPRDLGPVEVRLSIGDGAAQVSFSTQHAGTAAAVQQSLPQLRDLLAQQGLQLGQATVSHQPAGDGQAAQQQAPDPGGQPGWGRSRGGDLEDSLPMPTARVVGHGLVDAYA